MPYLIVTCLICLPTGLGAATLPPWSAPTASDIPVDVANLFAVLLHAWAVSYHGLPGVGPVSMTLLAAKLGGLAVVSVWMALSLPKSRRAQLARPYMALAARAMSWMR